jgi:hypothetical protein
LGENDEPAACTAHGAFLAATPTEVEVVVKARGYRTFHLLEKPSYDDCRSRLHATLEKLPELQSNADWADGFATLEKLLEMAVATPTESGDTWAVKFFIEDLYGDPKVYFQNTRLHPLHYEFVRVALGRAISRSDYEAQTYHGDDRTQMAGSVLLYPDRSIPSRFLAREVRSPLTIEFFPSDDLSTILALIAHRLLEERLLFVPLSGTDGRLFYLPPTATHEIATDAGAQRFLAWSAPWLRRDELYGNVRLQLLNSGKGCGTVLHLTPEQLPTTPLSYRDILVLSRLPNSVPLVAGTITEELQTPLAHVNVAARARGTPNLALLGASTDERIAPLIGKLACLEISRSHFLLAEVSQAEAQTFWGTLVPADPIVPEFDSASTGLWSFAELEFSDAVRVGAKAANLAELRRLLGDLTPDGFAIPFHYYDEFMQSARVTMSACVTADANCLEEGRDPSVCQEAAELCRTWVAGEPVIASYVDELLACVELKTDTLLREAVLDGLRNIMHHAPFDPDFGAMLDDAVYTLLGDTRARLRSSTNAEDLPTFSGAGLYRSLSSQVGTSMAPSSRVRKVWASVWNWQAFEEREYWRIDHHATKMAVAVHRSFPNEDANGVLVTQSIANPAIDGFYVNVQLGEKSVTNPEGGALPEIFTVMAGGALLRDRYSSLSPGQPILSDSEIAELYQSANQVLQHFAVLYAENPATFPLELEFKLIPPDRHLIIKQARPYFDR